mgnify:CR=1 FL=1|jgi:hypothetical protein
MKIQIKLTQAELRSIVARHLNLANGINADDLEITIDSTPVDLGKWTELYKWHTSAANNPNRKIEAIKGVRSAYPALDWPRPSMLWRRLGIVSLSM